MNTTRQSDKPQLAHVLYAEATLMEQLEQKKIHPREFFAFATSILVDTSFLLNKVKSFERGAKKKC
jgi:hypothetical protein